MHERIAVINVCSTSKHLPSRYRQSLGMSWICTQDTKDARNEQIKHPWNNKSWWRSSLLTFWFQDFTKTKQITASERPSWVQSHKLQWWGAWSPSWAWTAVFPHPTLVLNKDTRTHTHTSAHTQNLSELSEKIAKTIKTCLVSLWTLIPRYDSWWCEFASYLDHEFSLVQRSWQGVCSLRGLHTWDSTCIRRRLHILSLEDSLLCW